MGDLSTLRTPVSPSLTGSLGLHRDPVRESGPDTVRLEFGTGDTGGTRPNV